MPDWNMLTLVGEDRPGIVARVTAVLYEAGCTLGEASMLRLGASFTIMLMVSDGASGEHLQDALAPVARELGLRFHLDPIAGGLHRHLVPNIQVRVNGADRPGIVAQVTGALARTGFNILELESDVAGDVDAPVYIMNIQGYADATLEDIQAALADLERQGIDVDVCPIETLIG
jgi:glycine cleavage system transcriptional repressor